MVAESLLRTWDIYGKRKPDDRDMCDGWNYALSKIFVKKMLIWFPPGYSVQIGFEFNMWKRLISSQKDRDFDYKFIFYFL